MRSELEFCVFRARNSCCSDDQGEPESEEEDEEENDVAEALEKLAACHVVPADKPSPLRQEVVSSPQQHDEKDASRQSKVCGCELLVNS